MANGLPAWASEMRDLFRAGSTAQFILHGNVFDVIPAGGKQHSLQTFLDEVMFETFDVVLHYDRGKGIRATKGAEDYGKWLHEFAGDEMRTLAVERRPGPALELMDRYLLRTLNLRAIGRGKVPGIAIVIDFAEFVVPRGDPLQLGAEFSGNLVKMLSWANDPTILDANIAVVLVTEGLQNLDELIVENPHTAKLKIPLPGEPEMLEYLQTLAGGPIKDLASRSEVSVENLARRLTGLSRVGARTAISLALNNGKTLTSAWLSRMKKELIERETQGLLEFLESPFTLDNVAGLDEVKGWLREDATLLKRGALHTLPMGYLIAGRIGTGKTFIVQCWAGELGIPCVVFKNFRDKWVGATEANLEKIFAILRALGQVVVFVDEADQMTGKREGGGDDSGLSGRVYAMLAKEMSDTRNRGRILWVFATSRPDLLEVDLKRQGRLDVHIPLFPPQTPAEMNALLMAVAKKLKFPLAESDLPELPAGLQLGGNEIEGILVRALRIFELSPEPRRPLKDILAETFKEVRPSAFTRKLEYMDLVAVRECTDARFLPERYRNLPPEEVESRINELRPFV
jgi:hypothetical protein